MAKTINSKRALKRCLIVYAAVFLVGIVMACIFKVKLDINFVGGTRISYSYSGDIAEKDFEKSVKEVITKEFVVTQNTSLAGDEKTYVVTLVGRDSLSAKTQEELTENLQKAFADNDVKIYDSNSVSPTTAGSFFIKCIVAVVITALFVVLYVGIRFKKIGGVSAALTALCALVLDLLATFFACVIFRLQIDSNYMAVVLAILGYSLNDTIVVYDRVRENKKLFPQLSVSENMDKSISGVLTRNIVTSVTTVLAVLTIVVVSELYGLSSLRTFAIPMTFGLLSGCISSIFVAGPLWVYWKEHAAKKAPKKKKA